MKTVRINMMGQMLVPEDWVVRPTWDVENGPKNGSYMTTPSGEIVSLVVCVCIHDPKTGKDKYVLAKDVSMQDDESIVNMISYDFNDILEIK